MEFNQKITKNIKVKCPICQTIKNIDVPETVLSQKEFGTVKIQIPIGAVCQHQFLVFLDPQGIVRSYEKIDVHMTVSTEETPKEAAGILTLRKLIQIFGLYGVISLIHSKLFNYLSYIIIEEDFEHSEDLLNLIGDRMLPERYQGEKTIHLLLESDYNKRYRHLQIVKNALLMDTRQRSVQTPWDEKLRLEESMVKKALEIIDEEEQLFIIQNEILKFITEAETVRNVLKNAEGISEKDLKKQLIRELKIPKISNNRLKLIKEFIKRRIST